MHKCAVEALAVDLLIMLRRNSVSRFAGGYPAFAGHSDSGEALQMERYIILGYVMAMEPQATATTVERAEAQGRTWCSVLFMAPCMQVSLPPAIC